MWFVFLVTWAALASDVITPLQTLQINPTLKLSVQGEPVVTARGFSHVLRNERFEVHLKGTRIDSALGAKQKMRVELANVKNLYSPRGNPYEGQITDLIQCNKLFLPKTVSLNVAGRLSVDAVIAGANARHVLGACTAEQIGHYAAYFNLYEPESAMVVEARVFRKLDQVNATSVKTATADLQEFSRQLFVTSGARR